MKVFLDDERNTPQGWVRVYSVQELIELMESSGNDIEELSLDHDLGTGMQTGYDFMLWLEREVYEGRITKIPSMDFHTANPFGRENMERALRSIMRKLEENA
jgi:hypothetical protein